MSSDRKSLQHLPLGMTQDECLREATTAEYLGRTDAVDFWRKAAQDAYNASLGETPELELIGGVKGRTRFLIRWAKAHGIRLSAMLFLVATCTQRKWYQNFRGKRAAWCKPLQWYGEQIGVSPRQAARLIRQAKELHLLGFCRGRSGVLTWVADPLIYKEMKRNAEKGLDSYDNEYLVGYYRLKLADELGLNGSIVYCYLRAQDPIEEEVRRRFSTTDIALSLPWMETKDTMNELRVLERKGFIAREMDNSVYGYFWKPGCKEPNFCKTELSPLFRKQN